MIQSRRRSGLALKTLQRRGVFFQLVGQKLQSDVPAEIDVLGFIHDPHAAAAQLVKDAVMGDGFARDQQSTPKCLSDGRLRATGKSM